VQGQTIRSWQSVSVDNRVLIYTPSEGFFANLPCSCSPNLLVACNVPSYRTSKSGWPQMGVASDRTCRNSRAKLKPLNFLILPNFHKHLCVTSGLRYSGFVAFDSSSGPSTLITHFYAFRAIISMESLSSELAKRIFASHYTPIVR